MRVVKCVTYIIFKIVVVDYRFLQRYSDHYIKRKETHLTYTCPTRSNKMILRFIHDFS